MASPVPPAPDSSTKVKFLVNGEAINAAAPSRRFKHEGRWLYRSPRDDEAKFVTKAVAALDNKDTAWICVDDCDRVEAPVFRPVPLKESLLGVWRRGKDTTLVLSIPAGMRQLVHVSETGSDVSYERFYQQHNEYNSSCYSTYTEFDFPPGIEKSESEWNNQLMKFVETDHKLELLWWRDSTAKETLLGDLAKYKDRSAEYISSIVKRKQAAQGLGIKLLLGGEACCAMLSCEPCLVPLVQGCDAACACAPYQHHWFFKMHGVEVTADPSSTATPTSARRGDTATCHWSWAQCCCPLWPFLPLICLCVGEKE